MVRIKISGAGSINGLAEKLLLFSTLSNMTSSHSTKNKDNPTLQKQSQPVTCAPQLLTNTKIRYIFGDNYKNIFCYNFDSKHWNKNQYINGNINTRQDISQGAQKLKIAIEQEPEFKDFEVVAVVAMTISSAQHLFFSNFVHRPTFEKNGTAIVGNIICRNRKTGHIMPMSDTWLAGRDYTEQKYTIAHGVPDFINDCWGFDGCRRALMAINIPER